jgi:hypothetical protein
LPSKVLLITPPFTQLNTPYPATAYIKGFFNTKGISSFQADLGIDTTLQLFSSAGLSAIFNQTNTQSLKPNSKRIFALRHQYEQSIDTVIQFLQGKNNTIAYSIAQRNYLPEASRFQQLTELEWAFGTMGVQDQAKYLATLYLEDLSDFIKENIDEHFGFSRYAERLSRCANEFDELYNAVLEAPSFIDQYYLKTLHEYVVAQEPNLVVFTAPFPGNVYAAFKCGDYIKKNFPTIKIAFGGGFANTELRSLQDARVFEFVDFISLDDGELPLERIIQYLDGTCKKEDLKRTFIAENNAVVYYNNATACDYKQSEVGTPDYSDLRLHEYISAIEMANPMHSLWSNGRWNKLTMAHGCYWGKCTFCDTSLPYIADYEPLTASMLVDRMEALIAQTGETGFHFVDEAAPPKLMAALAQEICKLVDQCAF